MFFNTRYIGADLGIQGTFLCECLVGGGKKIILFKKKMENSKWRKKVSIKPKVLVSNHCGRSSGG